MTERVSDERLAEHIRRMPTEGTMVPFTEAVLWQIALDLRDLRERATDLEAKELAARACCEVIAERWAPNSSFVDLPEWIEVKMRALVGVAIKAENERLWAVFADLMDNEWPKRPDGSEYMQTDWNGLIDPCWPSDWPDRIMRDHGERT